LVPLAITQGKPARMTQKGSTMKRIILTGAALAALLTGSAVAAAPAFASNGPAVVKVNTHQNGVADTTDHAGSNTVDSPNGPVWAYDNLERKITATPNADGTWTVVVASQGSYAAFADPRTGGPAGFTSGPVSGDVTYVVQAGSAQPSGAGINSQSPLSLHSFDLVEALFGNAPLTIVSSHYNFDYKLAGQDYPQVG
jgi:hypothetical protein